MVTDTALTVLIQETCTATVSLVPFQEAGSSQWPAFPFD